MQNDLSFLSDEQRIQINDILYNLFVNHPNPEKSRSQFFRILNKSLSRVIFIQSLLDHPSQANLLGQLILKSDFFVDNLVADPHLFSWLMNTNILTDPFSVENMHKAAIRAANGSDQEKTRIKLLKQFQRKYIVAIGARDMLGIDSLYDTTSYISSLADFCLQQVSGILNERYFLNSSIPDFAVFALGKFGGRELNYSSDIDLLAICSGAESIEWKNQKEISVQDVLNKWVQDFISILTTQDSDGYFYRVDFRLRPEGEIGPLIPTSAGAINYYFSRGRLWERQMLLKIRKVLGSDSLSDSFLKAIHSFIFNPLKPIDGTTHLHQSLKSIHENNRLNERNIKTSPGSIRSVEFLCQTLQLEIGNHDSRLWNGNTLEILTLLESKRIILQSDKMQLEDAYIFYRRIEHHLQFYLNQQIHEIPESGDELRSFSKRFDGSSPKQLLDKIESVKQKVQSIVLKYYPISEQKQKTNNQNKVVQLLSDYIELPPTIIEMIEVCFPSPASKMISDLERIISGFPNPASLVKLWASDARFCQDVLMVIYEAPILVSKMLSVPEVWENLLSKSDFNLSDFSDPHLFQVHAELSNTIKYLKKKITFEHFTLQISSIYGQILNYYYGGQSGSNYLLIAFGKLGSKETGFASDADLTIVRLQESPLPFEDELTRRNQLLTVYTQYGQHFDVDFRLRPEGKNSSVVQYIETYYSYFEKRAEYWEFLTYSRSRLICGDPQYFQNLMQKINQCFNNRKEELISQFENMRLVRLRQLKYDALSANLKKDPGGLLDIEVFLQHYCLKYGISFYALNGKTIFDLCYYLNDITGDPRYSELKSLYLKLRLFETEQKLKDAYRSGIFQKKNGLNSKFYGSFDLLKESLTRSKTIIEELLSHK